LRVKPSKGKKGGYFLGRKKKKEYQEEKKKLRERRTHRTKGKRMRKKDLSKHFSGKK